jgi:hypothetical protein
MLWSETLFLLFSILFIATFVHYQKRPSHFNLVLCAILAGFACITRYAGITIIATGLMLLLFDRSIPWRQKIINLVIFFICSVSFLIANLWHNALITGLPTGPRESGITSLSTNIIYYGTVTSQWFPVGTQNPLLLTLLIIFLFATAVLCFFKRSWLKQHYTSAESAFIVFFIVYTVFIIGISTLSHFEQINNRLLSPLFIPMLITLTFWIPGKLKNLEGTQYKVALIALVAIFIAFTYSEIKQVNEQYTEAKNYGIAGYTDDSWKTSTTASFLRHHAAFFSPAYPIYSNAHEAAYFNGNMVTASIPHQIDRPDVDSFFDGQGKYLIWFDQITDKELISLKMISKKTVLVKKYDFKDGDIYFIQPVQPLPQQR